MKALRKILLFILVSKLVLSTYVYSNSYSFYTSIKSAALSPSNIYNQNGSYVNVAFLYLNGTVQISHTTSLSSSYSVINPLDSTNNIYWNQAGIILVSNSTVSVYDPYSLVRNLTISTNGGIKSAKVAIRNDFPKKIITAIAFSNRIQIFEDSTSKKNLTLVYTFQTMSLDSTGKYLYYFDYYTRYVYDLVFLNTFSQTSTSYNYKQLISSSKVGYEDITVSIDSYGYVNIWDDYSMLNTYTNVYNQNKIVFTEDSKYLVSADYSRFYVWLADYTTSKFSNWKVIQNETILSSLNDFDAKNGMFLYYSNYSIYIYRYQNDPDPVPPTSTTVVIIVVSIVGFLICVGVVVVCFKKKRAQSSQNQNYQPFDNQQSSNQGWNNQGTNNQGWNNQGANQGWNNQGANQGWNNQGTNPNQGWNNPTYNQPYNNNNQGYNPSPISNQGNNNSNPYGWN